ncbi:Minus-end-directed kinesin ATPase, partial [Bertholletia excelsa]
MDYLAKGNERSTYRNERIRSDVFEPTISSNGGDAQAKQRALLIEWINSLLPNLKLPIYASDEELRGCLHDGSVLCQILNKLVPGSVIECDISGHPSAHAENLKRFLQVMDLMKLPKFQASELEKGSMKNVLECLIALKAKFMPNFGNDTNPSAALIHHVGHKFHEVFQLKQGSYADLPAAKISEMMKSNSLDNAPTQSLLSVVNGILDESIDRKKGEIPHRVACLLRKVVQEIERRIATQAEHLRTQRNLSKGREEKYQSRIRVLEALATATSEESQVVVNRFQQFKAEKTRVEEQKKTEKVAVVGLAKGKDQINEEILTLKRDLEIAKKANEEKDQMNQEILTLKKELELARKANEEKDYINQETLTSKRQLEMSREANQEDQNDQDILTLRRELEIARKANEQKEQINQENLTLKGELEKARKENEEKDQIKQEILTLKGELEISKKGNKENDEINQEILTLKRELEIARKENEESSIQLKAAAEGAQLELEQKLKDVTHLLTESKNRVNELEVNSEAKTLQWSKKEQFYQISTEFQLGALKELKFASQSIKLEISKVQKSYLDDFNRLGIKLKVLAEASENYRAALAENRKLHNELQELKGNIRVYCRIRPFIPGQSSKQSIVDYIGENGDLSVANPSKPGKDGLRSFKFNKVYGPVATQVDVYSDIQPLIRSVLDGYNVCIFAYGQTGSGKTYTMTGPDGASEEDWGVNYRALNDLFNISQSRKRVFAYEIGIQMVEIYNEQVRDLLSNDGTPKKYPSLRFWIMSTSQPSGLAVPDATMRPVQAPSDVMELMELGLQNRAKGATAMNQRSSRSHSVVTIHVRGTDAKTGASLRGSLHLVDLAGSERVDRSEVTGDRLKEAQHINKSLSALGDVIFALAQKSSHIPYRNSKLTQLLQGSLGGHAKTLMFVQLNPELNSFTESLSTLKFAERVSGVELGAAKSSKEANRDLKELMEQVSSLRDTIAKKDEEIGRLQLAKDPKN